MTDIQNKILALSDIGLRLAQGGEELDFFVQQAVNQNAWFSSESIKIALEALSSRFLRADLLESWLKTYPQIPVAEPKTIGLTMAGNIPMVGFHDLLCLYLSGHRAKVKLSSKDAVLMRMLMQMIEERDSGFKEQVELAEQLKACDAYIATGSNNTARYFEAYFSKYPHIIRRNRTSVAVLDGTESAAQLAALAKDMFTYFGLGCRNVTQVCVPKGYDFEGLFKACEAYRSLIDHHKYRNNYDYYLAIYLLNKVPYLSNDFLLLVENVSPFSAVSVLHYTYYDNRDELLLSLKGSEDIQCIVAEGNTPFGEAQSPSLVDYPDGVDTMQFLSEI